METFKNIFALINYLEKIGYPIFPYNSKCHFQVVEFPDNKLFSVPEPLYGPLFRGQSSYYEICRPTIFRKLQNDFFSIINILKFEEWKLILQDHPYIKQFIENNIDVNYKGLAQHYGLDTNLLDLTNNIYVASFFATTDYNYETNSYKPVLERIRIGVLYLKPFGVFGPDQLASTKLKLLPVGHENLKRPGEQRAFSYEMSSEENFNTIPGIHKYFFYHDPDVSKKIFSFFNEGRKLFPYDPAERIVKELLATKSFSKEAFEHSLGQIGKSKKDVEELLKSNGYSINDETNIRFTKEDIKFYIEEHSKTFKE